MNQTFLLTRVMFKQTLQTSLTKSFGKRRKLLGTLLLSAFLIIYLGGAAGFLSAMLIQAFVDINQLSLLLMLVFAVVSVFIIFISLFSLPSLLYFSKDTERYLVLPVSGRSVMSAKLITSYLSTLLLTSIVTIPFGFAMLIVAKPTLLMMLFYILAIVVLPVLPLFIAVIITVIAFRFIPFVKNKELFTYISTAIGIGFSLIIVFASTASNIERISEIFMSVQAGDNQLINLIGAFIPTAKWLAISIMETNLLYILLTTALSLVVAIGSVYLLESFYMHAVVNVNEKSGKKRKASDSQRYAQSTRSSLMHSLIMYDLRNILRSPTFMMNYFATFIILPISMLIPIMSGSSLSAFIDGAFGINDLLKDVPLYFMIIGSLGIGFLISLFFSSFTTLTSTSLSREGQSLFSMQSMPIRMIDVIHAKIALGTMIMGVIPLLMGLTLLILFRINAFYVLLFIIGGLVGTLCGNIISILPDVYAPKLKWESEQEAIKQNFMAIIPMFGIMTLVGIIAFIMFKVGFNIGIPLGIILMLILTFIAYKLIHHFANTRLITILEKQ